MSEKFLKSNAMCFAKAEIQYSVTINCSFFIFTIQTELMLKSKFTLITANR